jgi:hypothetical protein
MDEMIVPAAIREGAIREGAMRQGAMRVAVTEEVAERVPELEAADLFQRRGGLMGGGRARPDLCTHRV